MLKRAHASWNAFILGWDLDLKNSILWCGYVRFEVRSFSFAIHAFVFDILSPKMEIYIVFGHQLRTCLGRKNLKSGFVVNCN